MKFFQIGACEIVLRALLGIGSVFHLSESFSVSAGSTMRCNFFHASRRRVDVRRSQPRTQQELSAEDAQRQTAIVPIVVMKETPFLLAVQRIISGIQVQDDFLRRFPVCFEEDLQQQRSTAP